MTCAWFRTLSTVLENSGQHERNVTMKFARLSLSSPPPFRIFRESLGTRLNHLREREREREMDPTGSSKVLLRLYPKVDESEAPLPRSWSNKDKYTYIGLSQSNLKVHYKGIVYCSHLCSRSGVPIMILF